MTSPTPPRLTMTARSPEDLIAMVPVVLGFVPARSVVLLTFGGRPIHARLDLPAGDDVDDPRVRRAVVDALLEPARQYAVHQVAFLVYSEDAPAAASMAGLLAAAFEDAGFDVLDALRVGDGRWFPLLPGWPEAARQGVPFDLSTHPFTVRSVFEGRVTHASRDALAASLTPRPELVARVELLSRQPGLALPAPSGVAWLRAVVTRHVELGTSPEDAEVARLVVGMREAVVRDAAWGLLSRSTAAAHVLFWTDVVRRTPPSLLAAPATLLGYAAWLAGHGALAWCALDLVRPVAPGYRLAGHLAAALQRAVSPSTWEELDMPASIARAVDDTVAGDPP